MTSLKKPFYGVHCWERLGGLLKYFEREAVSIDAPDELFCPYADKMNTLRAEMISGTRLGRMTFEFWN